MAAPEKILKRTKALTEYRLDALHFSYCMTALCPFLKKYEKIIKKHNPDLKIVHGTHSPRDKDVFRNEFKEIICPKVSIPKDMNDAIMGKLKSD